MKEMGIPMGPRKKLMEYMRNQKQNMVRGSRLCVLVHTACIPCWCVFVVGGGGGGGEGGAYYGINK